MKTDPRSFFDAIARRYDRVYALHGDASKDALARATALVAKCKRVLVLGVGTGRELAALLDAGHAPTGLDFSDEMLALCNRRARPVPLVRADFWEPLPFPDGAFDAALALHGTLAHPPAGESSIRALAKELARVLTRGSIVVAEIPTHAMLARIPPRYETEDGRRMEARPDGTLLHTDTVVGASIEAHLLDAAVWERAFCTYFAVELQDMGAGELRIVATKPRV